MLTLDRALSTLSQGKPGTCAILSTESGQPDFLGFGIRGAVIWLDAWVDGSHFTQAHFPFNLVMRKKKDEKTAWAVLADKDFHFLSASDDTQHSIRCRALIIPRDSVDTKSDPPLCLLARFDQLCSAVTAIQHDTELPKIILADSQTAHSAASSSHALEKGSALDDTSGNRPSAAQRSCW